MISRLTLSAIMLVLLLSAGCKTTKTVSDNKASGNKQSSQSPSSRQLGIGRHLDEKNDAGKDKTSPPKKASDDATQPAP